MNFRRYIEDKKYLIIFYVILMSFINLVIYFDINVKVSMDNILYINVVAGFVFILYLTIEYFYFKKYYLDLKSIIDNEYEDIINRLPKPKNYDHIIYNKLLRKLYDEQNIKIEHLHEEKKESQDFINTWVHEVKTPIAVSRLIIENSSGRPNQETLDSLEEEMDKIDNYIEQALYYSKIDDFSNDYFMNEVNTGKLIKDVIKKHAKSFINKRIKLSMDKIDMDIMTDKKWTFFILDQILGNSLKYTNQEGEIKIIVEGDEREKRIIIEDNGIGIKEEDINRVFDKGFTGYNGRENYKSTGMGLYLAKKLAQKLGHYVTIDSVYGEYTKVILHFPKLIDYFKPYH